MRLTGLASINKVYEEEKTRRENASKSRLNWLTLQDGETVEIRFLQELDESSPNFSEKNGLGFIAVEHTNPSNFHNKALCTAPEEDACVGCEQNTYGWAHKDDLNYKGQWKARRRFYINVLVRRTVKGKVEEEVAVLSQSDGPKSITPFVIKTATKAGSITDRWFELTRNGAGTATAYQIFPGDEAEGDVDGYELNDLDFAVRSVPYAEQTKFYRLDEEPVETEAPVKKSLAEEPASLDAVEW